MRKYSDERIEEIIAGIEAILKRHGELENARDFLDFMRKELEKQEQVQ